MTERTPWPQAYSPVLLTINTWPGGESRGLHRTAVDVNGSPLAAFLPMAVHSPGFLVAAGGTGPTGCGGGPGGGGGGGGRVPWQHYSPQGMGPVGDPPPPKHPPPPMYKAPPQHILATAGPHLGSSKALLPGGLGTPGAAAVTEGSGVMSAAAAAEPESVAEDPAADPLEALLVRVPFGYRRALVGAYRHALKKAAESISAGGGGLSRASVAGCLGPLGIDYWDDIFRLEEHEWEGSGDNAMLRPARGAWV